MIEDPKSCPCCASDNIHLTAQSGNFESVWVKIICLSCGLQTKDFPYQFWGGNTSKEAAEREATKRWNTRNAK